MSAPVAAQSLSSLTHLFANPPQYPRNPTHEVREPLVLYIVRVPGSKDVFLTPLKPPTKASISLEAIQSSLYYLHVASDQDEEFKRSIDEQRQSENSQRVNPPIHRKPLPRVPYSGYTLSERLEPVTERHYSHQSSTDGNVRVSLSERYAAGASHAVLESEREGLLTQHQPGPQRFHYSPQPNTPSGTFVQPAHDSLYSTRLEPSHLHQTSSTGGHESLDLQRHSFEDGLSRKLDPEPARGSKDDHLPKHRGNLPAITLIRRDPVSGSQWNVGSIAFGGVGLSSSSLGSVTLEITTPGYVRFASTLGTSHLKANFADAESIKEALHSGRLAGTEVKGNHSPQQTFCRVIEYQQQNINRAFKLHHRTESSDSTLKPPSPTKLIRQVYSFVSPWQGVCSFSNGIDGKSVRCRHALSSSTLPDEDTSVEVAELRFNLPWGTLASPSEKTVEGDTVPISKLIRSRPGKDALKRGIQHFRNMSLDKRGSSQEDNPTPQPLNPENQTEIDPDRLSLKLGREKAGGGYKGASAKLGKLIIEDEGLKMCDLIVAACMGVWWQHYESRID